MRTALWASALAVATGFAPTVDEQHQLTRCTATNSLQMSAALPPPPPPETLAVPAAATGRALLSWGNAPYIAGAAFGYRRYKTVSNIKEKQNKLIDEFGGKLKLGKKQSKAQFEATKKLYGKKLMFCR